MCAAVRPLYYLTTVEAGAGGREEGEEEEEEEEERRAVVNHDAYTLRLREVLSGPFEACILANYKWDMEFLLREAPQLALPEMRVVALHGSQTLFAEVAEEKVLRDGCRSWVVGRPRTESWGTFHNKYCVLFYPQAVRVAIFTANFVERDWTAKTQAVWLRDFPLKPLLAGGEEASAEYECEFERDLLRHLRETRNALQVQTPGGRGGGAQTRTAEEVAQDGFCAAGLTHLMERLGRFDFRSAGVALISTSPGKKPFAAAAQDSCCYGYQCLRAKLRKHAPVVAAAHADGGAGTGGGASPLQRYLSPSTLSGSSSSSSSSAPAAAAATATSNATAPSRPLRDTFIACQFSSLGSMGQHRWFTDQFIHALREGTRGGRRTQPRVQVVWPHTEAVRRSLEGWCAGGSIPCDRKNILVAGTRNQIREPFADILYKWDGTPACRQRAMPHIKTFCRYSVPRASLREDNAPPEVHVEWLMIGSHNLSQAAWGARLQTDPGHLFMRSFELGVLFTPSLARDGLMQPGSDFEAPNCPSKLRGRPLPAPSSSDTFLLDPSVYDHISYLHESAGEPPPVAEGETTLVVSRESTPGRASATAADAVAAASSSGTEEQVETKEAEDDTKGSKEKRRARATSAPKRRREVVDLTASDDGESEGVSYRKRNCERERDDRNDEEDDGDEKEDEAANDDVTRDSGNGHKRKRRRHAVTETPPAPLHVLLPHKLPPDRYTADDVPWAWNVEHTTPDVLGLTWRP